MSSVDRPVLSIVSGTYNRSGYLRRMVESVRRSLPRGFPYEFVIVDGGSVDETLSWCRAQPDIRLIEQGALRGAIRAFTDGAKAARGEYVLLANDDVSFSRSDSILRAIRHLEQTPTCAAVAFADNRFVPGAQPGRYKVQSMSVRKPDGTTGRAVYAQVGLFRKTLGDEVGWWGGDDPCMQQAAGTYGGDNWLTARLLERGYTIDPVHYVVCDDHAADDYLRAFNEAREEVNPHGYRRCYPEGPLLPATPRMAMEGPGRLRIVYLPIYEPGARQHIQRANKRGLREAFMKIGLVWEVDYVNEPFDLEAIVDAWQPDLLFIQIHSPKEINALRLRQARKRQPSMVVVTWNGDGHIPPLVNKAMLELLREVDLQLVVNAHVLPFYAKQGIRAAYWQIGYERPAAPYPDVPAHDVVFLGNCYSPERQMLEKVLRSITGNIGIYGSGWQKSNGDTLYDFAAGEALYRKAKIALSDCWSVKDNKAFISNRVFQALGAGVLVFQQYVPALEAYTGLRDGEHYVMWHDWDDLTTKIPLWLSPTKDEERLRIAQTGQNFVMTYYTFEALVRRLFEELLPKALKAEP